MKHISFSWSRRELSSELVRRDVGAELTYSLHSASPGQKQLLHLAAGAKLVVTDANLSFLSFFSYNLSLLMKLWYDYMMEVPHAIAHRDACRFSSSNSHKLSAQMLY